jgi:hypothetical protein
VRHFGPRRAAFFDLHQDSADKSAANRAMDLIIFRCPVTGLNVQWSAEEIKPDDETRVSSYQAVHCPACTKLHFVNPSTGKLLGEK